MRITNSFDSKNNIPFFIGKVEDNKDPNFSYRVKVRIQKLHPDSISVENLPWAARVDSTFLGIGDEQDLKHCVPEIGTYVLLLAINNEPNSLLYLGNLYKKTAQTPSGDEYLGNYGVYRKDGQFIGVDKINRIFKMLFDGDIEVDKVHNINIKASENITVNCTNATLIATNNIDAQCKNATIKAEENIDANCKNATVKAEENISIECKKADLKSEDTVNVQCKNATVKASSKTDITSPTMNMTGNINVKGNIDIIGNLKSSGTVAFTSYTSGTGQCIDTGDGIGGSIKVVVKSGVVTAIGE